MSAGPLPPKPSLPGRRQPTKRLRRDAENQPVKIKALAFSLPTRAWRTITWLEGTNGALRSRFACLRHSHRPTRFTSSQSWPEEWHLIEWPKGENEPTKKMVVDFACIVDLAKLRWCIERDYQELKQGVGLGNFEGRRWQGFPFGSSKTYASGSATRQ